MHDSEEGTVLGFERKNFLKICVSTTIYSRRLLEDFDEQTQHSYFVHSNAFQSNIRPESQEKTEGYSSVVIAECVLLTFIKCLNWHDIQRAHSFSKGLL